jgi:hypothetical protein
MGNQRQQKTDSGPNHKRHPEVSDQEDLRGLEPNRALSSSPTVIMKLQRTIGNQAVLRLTNGSRYTDTPAKKQPVTNRATTSQLQRAPTVTPIEVPTTRVKPKPRAADTKTDQELAAAIMQKQHAILVGWKTALDNFDKVLTSASDKESKPNFNKVLVSYLEDKLMKEFISHIPGAGKDAATDVFAVLGKLPAEVERARAASDSAKLRDFYVMYNTLIGTLIQSVLSLTTDFVQEVRLVEEKMLMGQNVDDYSMMRMGLVETYQGLVSQEQASTPQALFTVLTEQWLLASTAQSRYVPAWVGILVEEDLTILKAQIHGPGGQKIAEELIKESPEGVDVYNMQVPRQIAYYKKGKDYPTFLRLDANGRLVNQGIAIEGEDYMEVYRKIQAQGLKPTKNVEGD